MVIFLRSWSLFPGLRGTIFGQGYSLDRMGSSRKRSLRPPLSFWLSCLKERERCCYQSPRLGHLCAREPFRSWLATTFHVCPAQLQAREPKTCRSLGRSGTQRPPGLTQGQQPGPAWFSPEKGQVCVPRTGLLCCRAVVQTDPMLWGCCCCCREARQHTGLLA